MERSFQALYDGIERKGIATFVYSLHFMEYSVLKTFELSIKIQHFAKKFEKLTELATTKLIN